MSEEIKSEEELDKVPMLRTPIKAFAWAVAGIFGIATVTVAMLYIWLQVL